ncbi:MAG: hypothetical protein ABSF78_15600 [Candidatus Acidiferrales bacterium]
MPELNLFEEANRQLVICNACRYCEGLCPVFRAIETRRDFEKGDVFYLANLCHDCRACYYACMFTPPHEFAINIPQVLSEARVESYRQWSWPGFLGRAFKQQGIALLLAGAVILLVVLLGLALIGPPRLFALPGDGDPGGGAVFLRPRGLVSRHRSRLVGNGWKTRAEDQRASAGGGDWCCSRLALSKGRRTRLHISATASVVFAAHLPLPCVLGIPF